MKKRTLVMLYAAVVSAALLMAGCSGGTSETATAEVEETVTQETEEETSASDAETDQEAADKVAAMIDAIYVQKRTDDTDTQCAEAKAAWDALTDEQKELVEGKYADPDYFGRDTGDASLDDPRNQDDIGDKELLVVSFGTSYNDSRAKDIKGIEDALAKAFPDWSVRRAFTSQIIINHIQARDGEFIDNVDQALERAVNNGVKELVVQPTHLMHGAEYDELCSTLKDYEDDFDSVTVAEPLLGEVGSEADSVNDDKERVAKAVTAAALKSAGFDSLEEAVDDAAAFVFMGHGTSHTAKISYTQMQAQMYDLGYDNVYIGTVEGEPEETSCENIIESVGDGGYENVILRPLMVVAGDHANNDMAGDDDDSWMSMFTDSGFFESVEAQIEGLGRIPAIQQIYVDHTAAVTGSAGAGDLDDGEEDIAAEASGSEKLTDGTYTANFDTDSTMFHVNEAEDGKGILTVKDGSMTIHVSLVSKNIINLYPGTADEAEEAGAVLLEPTTDTVTYSDGTSEEVYGFDIPVPALDEEFDVAILGTSGSWYDHKVKVSDPEPLK